MRREIFLAPLAVEDFETLRAYERGIVREALETHLRYEPSKTSKSRIKRLRGMRRPQYRLRVGDIRIFYDVTDEAVEVLAIVPKQEAAAWLERYGEHDEPERRPSERR
jgi:mRNA interferase RelE/StbE